MIVRTSMVLVVTGTLFALVGAFAPAANLGADATPASLYQIVGGMLGWNVGAPAIPAGLVAIKMRVLGGAGVLAVCAFFAIALAVFKFLKSSLVPCLLMTAAAGYLMFTMAGIREVAVVVPASYGWILLIAGSLVASVTAFFTLFGTGPDERLRPKTEAPKKKGRLPFEVESTTVQEPPPPPPKPVEPPKPKPAPVKPAPPPLPEGRKVPLPKRDEPRQQRLSQAFRAEKPKAQEPKAESPKAESPRADSPKPEPPRPEPAKPEAAKPDAPKPEAPKPEAPKVQPAAASGEAAKAGAAGGTPGTLSPMPASGYSGEEPTESGGWVLSGFDANGMAVRLNISDVDLRSAEDGIVIGRNAKQCRLVLNDDSVSRRHARLSGSHPLTIEDLDSANGTVVNRQMLTPGEKIPIEPGVAIEIGAVRLTLVRS